MARSLFTCSAKLSYGFVMLMAISNVCCAQSNYAKKMNGGQHKVDAISAALSGEQIGRVEILHIPPRILTRAQITPEMLERQYYYKLVIRDLASTPYRNKMVDAFKSVSVRPRIDTADLRWGVIFYSRDDARVGALYFDKLGRYGVVSDAPVSFQGDFFHWLDTTFSQCFQ